MNSEILGLRTVVYMVSDLKKAKAWYVKALGIKPYYDTEYYVGFTVGGYELGLHPAKKGQKPDTGSAVAYWGVKDIKKSYARLVKLGAKGYEYPNNVGGDVIVAAVIDPWKNIFGLIYNPHFKITKSK